MEEVSRKHGYVENIGMEWMVLALWKLIANRHGTGRNCAGVYLDRANNIG
jgi:hypothetical protein